MASVTILSDNGATSGSAGLKTSGGNDGVLLLQTTTSGGTPTTAISISNTQVVTFTNQPTYTGGTANGVLYLNGSKAVTSGTALVFDGTNLGLGVTPPAAITPSLFVGQSNLNGLGNGAQLGGNIYWGGAGAWTTRTTGAYGARIDVNGGNNGSIQFHVSSSAGTAGSSATLTQAMTLDASGNLGIGTTSPTAKLHVQGNSSISTSDWYASSATIRAQATSGNNTQAAIVLMSRGPTGSPAGASIHSQPAGSDNYRAGLVNTITGDGTGQAYWSVNNFNPTTASTSELCRVTYDGNLLVGTTTAAEKITVTSGSIRTTSDNSCIVNGNDANLGFVKKGGFDGHLTASSSSPMIFSRLNQTTITSATVAAGTLSEFARFDTSGRFMVGRTSSSFLSTWSVAAIGQSAALAGPPDTNAILCANAYYDGSWKRTNAGYASILEMLLGATTVQFYTAGTSSAGSSISWTAGPYIANGGVSWTNGSSDVRQKKNFEPSQGLAELMQVEAVKYHFNWDEDTAPKRLGFKAQNLQPLIPEMVHEQPKKSEDGETLLTITPDYMLPVLVKAIQELKAEVDALKGQA